MAAGTKVNSPAAAMLGSEGAVLRFRAVVCQIAMDDKMGDVFDQLATPRQHRPGEQKQQHDGDEATHKL